MSIRKSPPANLIGLPNPEFEKNLFDAALWQKGYDCHVDKSIECPCRGGNENKPLPSCQNCGGVGWVFINPIQTKVLITGVNRDTKYKQWSQELIGNVSVSLRDIEQSGFMDRITILNETAIFSEVRKIRQVEVTPLSFLNFIFLSYEVKNIEDIFVFKADNQKLIRLNSEQWIVNPNNPYSIVFTDDVLTQSSNLTVSVRYKHNVQYHILDIPHVIRSSNITNGFGQLEKVRLPNQYMARLAHYVLRPDFDGDGIIDNSYL